MEKNFIEKDVIINHICRILLDFYRVQILSIQNPLNTAGKIREINGKMVEKFTILMCNLIHKNFFSEKNIKIVDANKDKKIITIYKNNEKYSIKHSVDIHIYIDNKLAIAIECKSYLDACFLKRSLLDLKTYRLNNEYKNIIPIIISFENSIKTQTQIFDCYNIGCYPEIFYFLDGKRCSKKPYWKYEFFKEINEHKMKKCINYFLNLFNNGKNNL